MVLHGCCSQHQFLASYISVAAPCVAQCINNAGIFPFFLLLSLLQVPKLTLIVGGSFGAGNYGM